MAAVRQRIIAVSGLKHSGKTTLLERLLPLLAERGLRCAVIKHDGHRFAPDREGTDTWRLLRAGAMGAAVFDGEKFQAVKYAAVTERELAALYPEADLIFLEGLKASAYPKLVVRRGETAPEAICDPRTVLAVAEEDADAGALAELVWRFVTEDEPDEADEPRKNGRPDQDNEPRKNDRPDQDNKPCAEAEPRKEEERRK